MPDRPSPDMLEAWLRLADNIERNGGVEPFDLELHLEQSTQAARGLRRLVAYVRSVPDKRD